MESALDVLSRAASLIQSEKKNDNPDRKESTGSNSSIDSGFEESSRAIESSTNISTNRHQQEASSNANSYNSTSKTWDGNIINLTRNSAPNISYSSYHLMDNHLKPTLKCETSYQQKQQNAALAFQRTSVITTSTTNFKKSLTDSTMNSERVINNCYTTFSNRYNPYERREQKKNLTQEFERPSVEDHFRKSLGEKYDILTCSVISERPSSVDEHFAKALGNKWYTTLEQSKCLPS